MLDPACRARKECLTCFNTCDQSRIQKNSLNTISAVATSLAMTPTQSRLSAYETTPHLASASSSKYNEASGEHPPADESV